MTDHYTSLGAIAALLDGLAHACELEEEKKKVYREHLENIERNLKPLF